MFSNRDRIAANFKPTGVETDRPKCSSRGIDDMLARGITSIASTLNQDLLFVCLQVQHRNLILFAFNHRCLNREKDGPLCSTLYKLPSPYPLRRLRKIALQYP